MALKLLELTRDPRTPIDRIAKLVQNDPALAAKILRTVNSSYYGLTNPCPTIGRAVSLLGLNTVKSLVLGFSLVEMSAQAQDGGFDLTAFWRRTIYSAAASRLLARRTGACDPEEAFVAALLQDVGMLAAFAALGDRYEDVLEHAPEDHRLLPPLEFMALGFDHAHIGSLLAEHWKLPPQVVECTRRHHQPDTAPSKLAALVRLVALGLDAASSLVLPGPREHVARFTAQAWTWFSIPREDAEALLQEIADGAAQLSTLLDIRTGVKPDVAAMLAEANEQLALHQIQVEHEASALQETNRQLARQASTDSLTGAANRSQFDAQIARAFRESVKSGASLAVIFIDADHFKLVNDTYGHSAGDAVLAELAGRMIQSVGARGTVYRYGGEEFVIVLPGMTTEQGEQAGREVSRSVQDRPFDLGGLSVGATGVRITISLGVAATDLITDGGHERLVQAADKAAYAAKLAGRNRVFVATKSGAVAGPSENASPAPTLRLVLVEDDPLAAKLIELMFAKQPGIRFETLPSAEEAMAALTAGASLPNVILCDLHLPGIQGVDLIRQLRRHPRLHSIPILAISQSRDAKLPAASASAGADAFATKSELCSDVDTWVARVVAMATRARARAA